MALGSREGICPDPWYLSTCQGLSTRSQGYVPVLLMINEKRDQAQPEGPSDQRHLLSWTRLVWKGKLMGHFPVPSQSAWECWLLCLEF